MLENIAAVMTNFLYMFLYAVEFAILVRVVLSWFVQEEDSVILAALYYLTEPFVIPVRALLFRIPAFSGMMFDFSYAITSLIIMVVLTFLPGVTL